MDRLLSRGARDAARIAALKKLRAHPHGIWNVASLADSLGFAAADEHARWKDPDRQSVGVMLRSLTAMGVMVPVGGAQLRRGQAVSVTLRIVPGTGARDTAALTRQIEHLERKTSPVVSSPKVSGDLYRRVKVLEERVTRLEEVARAVGEPSFPAVRHG